MEYVSNIEIPKGEILSHAIANLRTELESKFDANFSMFNGVKYDAKTDRYIAGFETYESQGKRKFDLKCSPAVSTFLTKHNGIVGANWYIKIEDGIITDVTIFHWNKAI